MLVFKNLITGCQKHISFKVNHILNMQNSIYISVSVMIHSRVASSLQTVAMLSVCVNRAVSASGWLQAVQRITVFCLRPQKTGERDRKKEAGSWHYCIQW